MKTRRVIVGTMMFMLSLANVAWAKPRPKNGDLKILSDKRQVVFFKVSRAYVGGWVEIFDANHVRLEADSLPHTHTMIYFDEMPSGHYTVRVKKGDKAVEFEYESI